MQTTAGGRPHTLTAVLASVIPASPRSRSVLRRSGWLTPYAAETLAEDARRAGRGARLEITLDRGAADGELAAVRQSFAWLATRGVSVRVRRGSSERAGGRHAADSSRRD